jgi:MFS family permease
MVGLERSILPLIAERDFRLASKSGILSFIVSFGIVKAIANLLAGWYSDTIGRKRLLVTGWLFGLPIPFIVMWAPSWRFITAANILLGINQGVCWSTTVIMKIDLVGPKRRGFAMGLNEFAGYGAVALAALASGYLASIYGLRPVPFYLGVGFAALGLVLSLTLVRDTTEHARQEERLHPAGKIEPPFFKKAFALTSYREPSLFSVSQAGLINNLNDGWLGGCSHYSLPLTASA